MKIIITEEQFNLVKEYFDPLFYLKNKFVKKPEQIKFEGNIQYEAEFQRYVDKIFKFAYRDMPLEHLHGFKVVKVTPSAQWTVLLTDDIDSWFNHCKNEKYKIKLQEFENHFLEIARMTAMGSPFSETWLPTRVDYVFWSSCLN